MYLLFSYMYQFDNESICLAIINCVTRYIIPTMDISTEYESAFNHVTLRNQIAIDQVFNNTKLINTIMEPFACFLIILLSVQQR